MPPFTSPPNPQQYNERVWQLVRQVPRGKVATYGQIALMIPPPTGVDFDAYRAQGPRWVGSAMAACHQFTGQDQRAAGRAETARTAGRRGRALRQG